MERNKERILIEVLIEMFNKQVIRDKIKELAGVFFADGNEKDFHVFFMYFIEHSRYDITTQQFSQFCRCIKDLIVKTSRNPVRYKLKPPWYAAVPDAENEVKTEVFINQTKQRC